MSERDEIIGKAYSFGFHDLPLNNLFIGDNNVKFSLDPVNNDRKKYERSEYLLRLLLLIEGYILEIQFDKTNEEYLSYEKHFPYWVVYSKMTNGFVKITKHGICSLLLGNFYHSFSNYFCNMIIKKNAVLPKLKSKLVMQRRNINKNEKGFDIFSDIIKNSDFKIVKIFNKHWKNLSHSLFIFNNEIEDDELLTFLFINDEYLPSFGISGGICGRSQWRDVLNEYKLVIIQSSENDKDYSE
jgi:hypothetical protein